jgi:hypothetical protein
MTATLPAAFADRLTRILPADHPAKGEKAAAGSFSTSHT